MKKRQTLREMYERQIAWIVERLKQAYQPEKIILFGSVANEDFHEDSDIDMLIIKQTDKQRRERIKEVYDIVYAPNHYLAFEPLVYTPEEIVERMEMGDFFIEDILTDGQVLYDHPKELAPAS